MLKNKNPKRHVSYRRRMGLVLRHFLCLTMSIVW